MREGGKKQQRVLTPLAFTSYLLPVVPLQRQHHPQLPSEHRRLNVSGFRLLIRHRTFGEVKEVECDLALVYFSGYLLVSVLEIDTEPTRWVSSVPIWKGEV